MPGKPRAPVSEASPWMAEGGYCLGGMKELGLTASTVFHALDITEEDAVCSVVPKYH